LSLRDRLPLVPIPLLPPDADVSLDLQASFQNVYDFGGYDFVLDYTKAPPVPLKGAQAAWVAERLRAATK